jgi:hypothetical protein
LANYTLTTTAGQETALTEAVAIQNAQDGTALTNAQFVQAHAFPALVAVVQGLRSQKAANDARTVAVAYAGATTAVQNQVEELLGLPNL